MAREAGSSEMGKDAGLFFRNVKTGMKKEG
jgi:hypothetical protein